MLEGVGTKSPRGIVDPGLNRRLFLAGTVGAALVASRPRSARAGAATRPFLGTPSGILGTPSGKRLVVLGASFAGITAARQVKKLVPDAEVVLVERAPFFVSGPGTLGYLFGLLRWEEIARRFDALAQSGLRIVNSTVVAVEPERRRVVMTSGTVEYDLLLVCTGARPAYEEVPGLEERLGVNLALYETGPSIRQERRRIDAFPGGHVVVTTPVGAYKCLPAPYEYALLWAQSLARRRLKGTVTLVDPRPRPTPAALAPGLMVAMDAHAGRLTYEPFARLISVDAARRTVETDAGALRFDLLTVIPTNTAMAFVLASGLGDPFVDVDLATFRSSRDPRVYAVGDVADTPFAKTAATAMSCARMAAHAIARTWGTTVGDPTPARNLCFPMVSPERAMMIDTEWRLEAESSGAVKVETQGTTDVDPKRSHLRARRSWEAQILKEMFGA